MDTYGYSRLGSSLTTYVMQLTEGNHTTYPVDALREWAIQSLNVKRCSSAYLIALSIVLGNMARADAHGVRLILKTIVPWATRQTMRTLLEQLCEAKWITRWRNPKQATYAYSGGTNKGQKEDSSAEYSRIQREAEEGDFKRYLNALGINPEDCPY